MKARLRRIAAAGNAVALVLVVVVLAQWPALFGRAENESRGGARPRPGGGASPERVLLVIVDGLRLDRSLDPGLMPHLNRLARDGGRGVAVVESWIPSTVAGIRTLAEGRVPPPASFLEDFGTSRSKTGGIFAAGFRRPFAAGPRLWADLYGPWLAGGESVATVSGDDARLLAAGLRALEGDHDLVVVHLSELDDAAHARGGGSREYADALARSDAALGSLVEHAGPGTSVVVTADHGVTEQGGHAGPEPEVVETPLVVHGPGLPRGDLGRIRQRDVHRLFARLPEPPEPFEPSRPSRHAAALAAAFALVCCASLARRLPGLEGSGPATGLNAALWVSLALAALGFPAAALLVALGTLAAFALFPRAVETAALWACAGALQAGFALGGLRFLDGLSAPPGLPLLLVCALGLIGGLALQPTLLSGCAAGLAPAVLTWLLGETVSLSTLDVRLAFRVVDGPLGLAGAVAVVLLAQALPPLSVALGAARGLGRAEPRETGSFAAGLGLALAGQAGAAALALAYWRDQTGGSLAVGLLVRLTGEVTFLFLGLSWGLAWRLAQAARRTFSAAAGHAPLRKASAAGKNSCGRSM